MKLRSTEAILNPDNVKSVALLNRNGFVYAGKLGDAVVYRLNSYLFNAIQVVQ